MYGNPTEYANGIIRLKKDKASGEMPSCMLVNALYTRSQASLRGHIPREGRYGRYNLPYVDYGVSFQVSISSISSQKT